MYFFLVYGQITDTFKFPRYDIQNSLYCFVATISKIVFIDSLTYK